MSWQAVRWAIHDAPVDDSSELMVLIAICERADEYGRNAYPSVAWIADVARCSPRTAHRHIRKLRKEGLVVDGDQSLVAHFRADRRPSVYDVDMSRRCDGVSPVSPREASGGADDVTPMTGRDAGRGVTDDMSSVSRRDSHDMSSASCREPRGDKPGTHGVSPVADNKALPPTEVNPPNNQTAAASDGAPKRTRTTKPKKTPDPVNVEANAIVDAYIAWLRPRKPNGKIVDEGRMHQALARNYVAPALRAGREVDVIKRCLSRASEQGHDWPNPTLWRQLLDGFEKPTTGNGRRHQSDGYRNGVALARRLYEEEQAAQQADQLAIEGTQQ